MTLGSIPTRIAAPILALLLAACGGTAAQPDTVPAPTAPAAAAPTSGPENEPTSAGAAAGDGDPCAVLTQEELGTALGAPVTRAEADGSRCTYYTDDPVVFATVEVQREDGAAAFEGAKAGVDLTGDSPNAVSGIGDEAFFGQRDVLYVRSGDAFVSIEAGFDDAVRERAQKVAPLVLDGLE